MIKIKNGLLIGVCFTLSNTYAGDMNPVSATIFKATPFAGIEGSYTWPQVKPVTINGVSSNQTINHWGGRAFGGVMHPILTNFKFGEEIGWASFGKYSDVATGSSNSSNIYGFDVLLKAMYEYRQLALFAGAGAMIETIRTSSVQDTAITQPADSVSGIKAISSSVTNIMPELKVGGIYKYTEQLGISLAYMYAFGYNVKTKITASVTGDTFNLSDTINDAPLSLSTIMLGLYYNF